MLSIYKTLLVLLILIFSNCTMASLDSVFATNINSEDVILFKKVTLMANNGDADAQFNLGRLYEYGRGVAKDPVQAQQWFLKAAQQKNADASYHLGFRYETGRGVRKDYTQALKWYRIAAKQGSDEASSYLEFEYEATHTGMKYEEWASGWYRDAANRGNEDAKS